MTYLDAFLAMTDRSICWPWPGMWDVWGYGRVGVNGHQRGAHRAVYELMVGPVPDGLELDHLCRFRACVNPDHLEPVTHAENVRRIHVRQTHCLYGHEFNEVNTRYRGNARRCRVCERRRSADYKVRRLAKANSV